MCQGTTTPCANCERMQQQLEAMQQQLQQQQQTLAALREEIRELKEKLAAKSKDSSTSSKPPSSDIVKPGKDSAATESSPRRGGGQPGHPKHQRTAFPTEELTGGSHTFEMTHCPSCHTPVVPTNQLPPIVEQSDLLPPPMESTEHLALPYSCPQCSRIHFADLPGDLELGGPMSLRLTA